MQGPAEDGQTPFLNPYILENVRKKALEFQKINCKPKYEAFNHPSTINTNTLEKVNYQSSKPNKVEQSIFPNEDISEQQIAKGCKRFKKTEDTFIDSNFANKKKSKKKFVNKSNKEINVVSCNNQTLTKLLEANEGNNQQEDYLYEYLKEKKARDKIEKFPTPFTNFYIGLLTANCANKEKNIDIQQIMIQNQLSLMGICDINDSYKFNLNPGWEMCLTDGINGIGIAFSPAMLPILEERKIINQKLISIKLAGPNFNIRTVIANFTYINYIFEDFINDKKELEKEVNQFAKKDLVFIMVLTLGKRLKYLSELFCKHRLIAVGAIRIKKRVCFIVVNQTEIAENITHNLYKLLAVVKCDFDSQHLTQQTISRTMLNSENNFIVRKRMDAFPLMQKNIPRFHFGTWCGNPKFEYIAVKQFMIKYELGVLGVTDINLKKIGLFYLDEGWLLCRAGNEQSNQSLGFLINPECSQALLNYRVVSPDIFSARFVAVPMDFTFIIACAPSQSLSTLEAFYDTLQTECAKKSKTDVIVLMGNFHVKFGLDYKSASKNYRFLNIFQKSFLTFCRKNRFIIINSLYGKSILDQMTINDEKQLDIVLMLQKRSVGIKNTVHHLNEANHLLRTMLPVCSKFTKNVFWSFIY